MVNLAQGLLKIPQNDLSWQCSNSHLNLGLYIVFIVGLNISFRVSLIAYSLVRIIFYYFLPWLINYLNNVTIMWSEYWQKRSERLKSKLLFSSTNFAKCTYLVFAIYWYVIHRFVIGNYQYRHVKHRQWWRHMFD